MLPEIICDLYLRLSDLREEDMNDAGASTGLLEHERLLRARCALEGWTVGQVIVENDMGKIKADGKRARPASAFKRKKIRLRDGSETWRTVRPGFELLLQRLRTGQAQAILAMDLDRVVRDPRDLEDLIDVAEARKINARSISGSLTLTNGGTDSEISMARIMVAVANKSSRDTRRRVEGARLRQATNGEYGGGRRAFGFDSDGVTIRPQEAELIREMAKAVLSGQSLRSIAVALQATEHRTSRGIHWNSRAVKEVLLRPRNIAKTVHQKAEIADANWEAILTEPQFRAIYAILTDPARNTNSVPGPTRKWLGSGIYKCVCGARLEGHRYQLKAQAAYRCSEYRKAPTGSGHVSRNVASVDFFVESVMIKWAGTETAKLHLAKKFPQHDVEAQQLELVSIRELLKEFARDRADELISREEWIAGTTKLRTRARALELSMIHSAMESPLDDLIRAEDREAQWHSFPLDIKRSLIDEILEVVLVPTTRRGPGFDPAGIRVTQRLETTEG